MTIPVFQIGTPDALDRHITALDREAGGLIRISIVHPEDAPALIVAAMDGDQFSHAILNAVSETARQIAAAPRGSEVLCLVCPAAIRTLPGVAFVVVLPQVSGPHHGLGSAVCPKCAARPDLNGHVTATLRKVWPGLREIQIAPGSEALH